MKYYFLVNEKLIKLCEIVEERFSNSTKPAYLHHTLRVANYCYQIGTIEKVDLAIMIATALIHDIGKTVNPGFKEHINCLKETASKILLDCGYSLEEIENIVNIAISHHPEKDILLNDIYEQILFDADNLDCVGTFGIIRWYNSIPSKLENMIEDAKWYINNYSANNRDNFFYTKYAHEKANHLVKDGIDSANRIIKFCESSLKQAEDLFPM